GRDRAPPRRGGGARGGAPPPRRRGAGAAAPPRLSSADALSYREARVMTSVEPRAEGVPAAPPRPAAPPERDTRYTARKEDLRVIGRPLRKVDAYAKVTGLTRFADDLVLPRMLFMKLLRSTKAHARIVRIDVSKARALPGVHAVITGESMPTPFAILPVSQDEHALAHGKVRMISDPVAAVAAVDEVTAAHACRLIEVEY